MRMLMRQMLVHARKHEIWLVSANAEGCAQTQAKQDLDRLQQAYRCLHPHPTPDFVPHAPCVVQSSLKSG